MATTIPTITTISTVDPTYSSSLYLVLTSATHALATATYEGDQYWYSKKAAAASNSLAIISAQAVLATASGEAKLLASEVIMSAATEIAKIEYLDNMYRADLNMGGNVFYAVIFCLVMLFHFIYGGMRHYWYYMCMLGIGSGLDFGGYIARCVSATDETLVNPFLVQIILLTIAPAFIMAGIYYMLGRQLVFIGPGFSWLKPRWFSYIYISCDIISLVIQAAGGGTAAVALENNKDTDTGTHIMVAGIAFQVFTMSTFFIVGGNFVMRCWFRALPNVKFSIGNFLALALNTPRARELYAQLEPHYDPQYIEVRSRPLFPFCFSAIFVGTVLIYIRCIYRLVELAEGWTGYVIRHEAFLFTLDALMCFLTCALFIVFHPGFIWGKHQPTLSFRNKKKNTEVDHEKLFEDSNLASPSDRSGDYAQANDKEWNGGERGSYDSR